jgi:hypothetical protein
MARDKQIGGIMETKDKVKVQALSAEAIIDNARERFVDIEEYIIGKEKMFEHQHVLIEEADN